MSEPLPKPPPLRRLWDYADGHRREVVVASTFSVLNKLMDLAPPLLIGMAVDVVVEREGSLLAGLGVVEPMTQLWVIGVLTLVIWGLESLFEYLFEVAWRNLAQTIQHEIRLDAYAHVQNLEMRYFEDRSTGGLMAVLNDDVNQLERFLNVGANDLLQVGTTVVTIGAVFFALEPTVAAFAFLPIPAVLWGSFRFQRRIAPRYAAVRESVALLNESLANNLGGIATIKSFTAEDREVERIAEESDDYRDRNAAAIRLSSAFIPLIRMAILAGFLATLIWGGALTLGGSLAVGSYSVMVFMTQRLLWPLTGLGETVDLYQRAMASTTRILDLLDTVPELPDGTRSLPASEVAGQVVFDDIGFHYVPGTPVLRDLHLTFAAGQTTAIVGSTGSGKTTVVKLLLRFYDPQAGSIRLDGHDLRELRSRDLRAAIGLVSQDVFLFHGTVRQNIAYGRPGATEDEIVEAARVAEADEFVRALPNGYETIVGERGQKLSGGQRQRISIARAVLKDPPILVFDEATSSVDNETEAAIQHALEKLAVGRTTIVIAHRLSTVRNADRIYVMADGRVSEVGRHEDLVGEASGIYANLWRVQTGERAS